MTNLQKFDKHVLTMTSRDIAELVESRHDDTKRSIERLAERGVIELPPLAEIPTATKPVQVYVFSGEQGKRDSIIVVAQLSPEFTARLVDRWQELEAQVAKVLNRGIGRNRLFAFLRDEGVLDSRNAPYQRFVDAGWFRQVETKWQKANGDWQIGIKTVVFQKGVEGIARLLDKKEAA